MRSKLLAAIVAIAVLMTAMTASVSPTASASLTTSAQIDINGNSDLSGYPGAGTAMDPKVISDLSINVTDGVGISISNVTLYITIYHCTIYASNIGIEIIGSSNITLNNNNCSGNVLGIYLESSSNNTVVNNICNDNTDQGIFLLYSNDCTIEDNICNSNSNCGIYLYCSNSAAITNNFCNGNGQGIYLCSSNGTSIANNVCNYNTDQAMFLASSNDCIIVNNTCIGNSYCGIYLYSSNGTTVAKNVITGDLGSYGIYLDSNSADLSENRLTNCAIMLWFNDQGSAIPSYIDAMNIATSNTVNGLAVFFLKDQNMGNASVPSSAGEVILLNVTYAKVNGLNMNGGAVLFWCSHITVENNVITGAADAVCMWLSENCTVTNNRIIDAWNNGICSYLSSDNSITQNAIIIDHYSINLKDRYNRTDIISEIIDYGYGGIILYGSEGNNISDNVITDSWYCGIYMEGSDVNSLFNNVIANPYWCGLYLKNSTGNGLINNTVSSAAEGIFLWYSSGNTISLNNMQGVDYGIDIEKTSDHNTVSQNLIDDGYVGMYIWNAGSNMIVNNTMTGADDQGIYMDTITGSVFTGNKIVDSASYGISVINCDGSNLICANVLIDNNGATSEYDISHIQAYDDHGAQWNDGMIGNYWGDWQSPDYDHDGIVDVAYAIDGGQGVQDNMPILVSLNIASPVSPEYSLVDFIIVSGTAVDGSGIKTITWHNQASGDSGPCTGTSSWSARVALVEGENDIIVTLTDPMGYSVQDNVTVLYSDGLFITSWPSSPVFTDQSDVVATVSAIDRFPLTTGNYTHFVNGHLVEYGSMVTLVPGETEFSLTQSYHLYPGTNVWSITLNDSAYNSETLDLIFIYDLTAPIVTVISPSNNSLSNSEDITIAWSGSDDLSGIAYYNLSIFDGIAWDNISNIASSEVRMQLSGLESGNYSVMLEAVDKLGNTGLASVTFIVDTVGSVLVVDSPISGSYSNTGEVTVQWTASDETSGLSKTEVSTDGTIWTVVFGNSRTLSLADGPCTFYVKVTDKAGNVVQTSTSFTVDTVRPVLVITDNSYGKNSLVTVQWTASDETSGLSKTEVSTDGTIWTVVFGNSRTLSLADGPCTFYVKVTDKAGNVVQTSETLTVDNVAPTIMAKTPIDCVVSKGATVAVLFSERMNKATTTISIDGVDGALTWSGNNATFTPSAALEYNTTYTVTVRGEDLAGNALATTDWTFATMKDEGHFLSMLRDADGNAIAYATVTLSNGMTTTTDANGYFEFKNVTAGTYTMTITKDGYQIVKQYISTAAGETHTFNTLSEKASSSSTDDTTPLLSGTVMILAMLGGILVVLNRRKK